MNKQELIEKYEYLNHDCFRRVDTSEVLKDLKQLDKSQEVPVPQFVAGWIEQRKDEGWELSQMFLQANLEEKYGRWIVDNQETFARAWLDGYEVEKEKRYLVKMKGLETDEAYLKFQLDDKYWYMGIVGDYKHAKTKHTRKKLEEAGFGWVFDCPGIEIEEVGE